jgi:hypothetical protein
MVTAQKLQRSAPLPGRKRAAHNPGERRRSVMWHMTRRLPVAGR